MVKKVVKKILTDPEPVTRSFLLKTALSMIAIIAGMLVFAFQAGGIFGNYSKLSKIPVADIKRAVDYSVYEQQSRKDSYRSYMNNNDLVNNTQNIDIKSLKDWRVDVKDDVKEIKTAINEINRKLK